MSGPKKPKLSKSVGIKVTTYSVSSSSVKWRTGYEKLEKVTNQGRPDAFSSDGPVSDNSISDPEITVVGKEKAGIRETYAVRKVSEIEEWIKAVDEMVVAAVKGNAPTSFECGVCGVEAEDIIRCLDCGPFSYCCSGCEKIVHRGGRLHKPEIWKENVFELYSSDPQCWNTSAHECTSKSLRGMELYDEKGRRHFVLVTFCDCQSAAATLLQYGFWPSSTSRPSAAFSMQLMRMLHYLTLECSVSVKGFVQTLRWNHNLSDEEANRLYQLLIGESITHYRAFLHKYETCYRDHTTLRATDELCPMCPKDGGVVTVSLDANFGLVRKHNAGSSFVETKYDDSYFVDRSEVDTFVSSYDDGKQTDKVVYDIACVLTRHLKRTQQENLLVNTSFGLPVFHAYGHNTACQVTYSTRRLENFGLTDGEAVERLWSYLRTLAKISKEMTPSHRRQLLDLALFHFRERKIASLAKWIVMRAKRATDVHTEADTKLTNLLQVTEGEIDSVAEWHVEQRQKMSCTVGKTNEADPVSWEGKYVCQLKDYYNIRMQMSASTSGPVTLKVLSEKLQRLEESLRRLEKQHLVGARWQLTDTSFVAATAALDTSERKQLLLQLQRDASDRSFIVSLLAKYCDGQQSAIRLSKQLTKLTKEIKKKIQSYNDRRSGSGTVDGSTLPAVLSLEDVTHPAGPVFSTLRPEPESAESSSAAVSTVPWPVRCQAVDLYCLKQRAGEELERIKADTLQALQHFVSLHDQLAGAAAADHLCTGLRALLLGKAQAVRSTMLSLWTVGQPLLKDRLELDHSLSVLSDRCVALCSSQSSASMVTAPDADLDSADCDDILSDQSDTESTDSGDDQ